ncbi:MAG: RimK family alpha-L-glutamate ligase [Candidatus Lokiarchaeota archaeon]|nr:RimK family alpha-L-glutamate ligase [Candidatus Lokiarchaeota archaeon]
MGRVNIIKISIAINRVNWEEKEIIQDLKKRNVQVEIIDNKNVFYDLEIPTLKTDIVLDRSLSYLRGLYLTAILEYQGYKVVNSYETARICGDKLITSLELIKNRLPIAKTYCAFTKDSSLNALEELGYPAVIKPIIGSWGRLIALLRDKEMAKSILEEREVMGQLYQKIFYLQEYIKKPARNIREYSNREKVPRDIRVIVIGDEVIEAMYRFESINDWRSAATMGAKTSTCPITSEIEDISLKAAKAVNGEILGIDLMENEDRKLIIQEINHTCGFKAISLTTGNDIASKINDYLISQVKN